MTLYFYDDYEREEERQLRLEHEALEALKWSSEMCNIKLSDVLEEIQLEKDLGNYLL
jgi:hypothetical protein